MVTFFKGTMAGQPKQRELDYKLQALGGAEYLCEQFSAGASIRAVARQLEVSHFQLQTWIRRRPPAERQAIAAIRASEHVETAIEQIDAADSPSAMSVAREKARIRTWAAERIDREAWGNQGPAPTTVVNVNTLHLTALQSLTALTTQQDVPQVEHHVGLARVRAIEAGPGSGDGVVTADYVVLDENHNNTDQMVDHTQGVEGQEVRPDNAA